MSFLLPTDIEEKSQTCYLFTSVTSIQTVPRLKLACMTAKQNQIKGNLRLKQVPNQT